MLTDVGTLKAPVLAAVRGADLGLQQHLAARGVGVRTADYGDADSLGLFQQRPSQGWGTVAQILTPTYASTKFYTKLLTVKGWQTLPLTVAAQDVQRSAYPDAYAKWEPDATQLVGALVADHNGQRLAKRHDALALRTLRQRGLTPMNIFSAELPVLV